MSAPIGRQRLVPASSPWAKVVLVCEDGRGVLLARFGWADAEPPPFVCVEAPGETTRFALRHRIGEQIAYYSPEETS